jgi:hypothetical protein
MSLDRSGHTPATPLEIAVTAVAASKGIAELGAVPLVASALGSVGMSLWAGSQPLPGAPALRYAGARWSPPQRFRSRKQVAPDSICGR